MNSTSADHVYSQVPDGLGDVITGIEKDAVMVVVVKGDDKWWKVQCSNGLEVTPSALSWTTDAHVLMHMQTLSNARQGWVLSANKRSTMVENIEESDEASGRWGAFLLSSDRKAVAYSYNIREVLKSLPGL